MIKVLQPQLMHGNSFLKNGAYRIGPKLAKEPWAIHLGYDVVAEMRLDRKRCMVAVSVDASTGAPFAGGWVGPDGEPETYETAVPEFTSKVPFHKQAVESIRFGWDLTNYEYGKVYSEPAEVLIDKEAIPRPLAAVVVPEEYRAMIDLQTGRLMKLTLLSAGESIRMDVSLEERNQLISACRDSRLLNSLGFDELGIHYSLADSCLDTKQSALIVPRKWGNYLFLDEYLTLNVKSISPAAISGLEVKTFFREPVVTPAVKLGAKSAQEKLMALLQKPEFRKHLLANDGSASEDVKIEKAEQPFLVTPDTKLLDSFGYKKDRKTAPRLCHIFRTQLNEKDDDATRLICVDARDGRVIAEMDASKCPMTPILFP